MQALDTHKNNVIADSPDFDLWIMKNARLAHSDPAFIINLALTGSLHMQSPSLFFFQLQYTHS